MAKPRTVELARRREPARGATSPAYPNVKQILVRLDDETFEQVRQRAIAENTSFNEQVRQLVEWGLEAAGQP